MVMESELIELKNKYESLLNEETYDLVNYGKQQALEQVIYDLNKIINDSKNS